MKKKQLLALTILGFCAMSYFSGCSIEISKKGIENFRTAQSSFGITSYLLPSDENGLSNTANTGYFFLDNYEFIDGNYFYKYSEDAPYLNIRDTAFMWLQYEADIYKEAKAYMFDITPMSEKYTYIYNDYYFHTRMMSRGSTNMLGYNDTKNILVFYGIYTSDANYEKKKQFIDNGDWGGFLKEFYPEYDFDV